MKIHPLAALAFAALLPHFGQAQSVVRTIKKLPDTGQNTSYTNTFGEDNDYSINTEKFSVKNGIVIDSVTTLMWLQTDGGEMLFDNAKNYSLSQAIFNDETIKNLPTGQYVFTLYSHENTVVYSKIISKENP